jgi:hypothetical protein
MIPAVGLPVTAHRADRRRCNLRLVVGLLVMITIFTGGRADDKFRCTFIPPSRPGLVIRHVAAVAASPQRGSSTLVETWRLRFPIDGSVSCAAWLDMFRSVPCCLVYALLALQSRDVGQTHRRDQGSKSWMGAWMGPVQLESGTEWVTTHWCSSNTGVFQQVPRR